MANAGASSNGSDQPGNKVEPKSLLDFGSTGKRAVGDQPPSQTNESPHSWQYRFSPAPKAS